MLIILIEKFEQKYYSPGNGSEPHSMLLFLIEQRAIQQADLVGIIGSEEVILEVVSGRREISKAEAKALGEFFRVDSDLFI